MVHLRLARPSLQRTVPAATIAATAYIATMAADQRLIGNRYSDLVFWGGYLTRKPKLQRLLGAAVIYSVANVVAGAYAALLPALPRWPGPLLGALFVQAENSLRFPTLVAMSAFHPSVRRGELPPLWTWRYYAVEADRHIAFGLVLGLLLRRSN